MLYPQIKGKVTDIQNLLIMAKIKSEKEYQKLLQRINELLEIVDDDTPKDDVNYIELDTLSDLVEEYEDAHYPIGKPFVG